MPSIKKCEFCGKEYKLEFSAQKYCCEECKLKSKKPRIRRKIKECPVCGKRFEGGYRTKYCSMACASIANGKRVKAVCPTCGKTFYRRKSHVRIYTDNFCSKECHDNSMKLEISKVCLYCGKEFSGKPSTINREKYCSVKCGQKAGKITIPYETIYRLYVTDKKNTRQIGRELNVSKHKISDTLREYDIPIRDIYTQRKGEKYSIPTKEELENLYFKKYMTFKEIGKVYKTEQSNIGVWFKKYGIKARNSGESKKGKDFVMPTRDQIKDLYIEKESTSSEIATLFHATNTTICKIIKDYGFETRPNIWNGRKFLKCKDGHEVRSNLEKIVDNYLYDNNIEHEYERRLPGKYYRYMTDFYVKGTYIEIWGVTHNQKYEEKRKKKEMAYKTCNLKLLSLEPEDFRDSNILYSKLNRIS